MIDMGKIWVLAFLTMLAVSHAISWEQYITLTPREKMIIVASRLSLMEENKLPYPSELGVVAREQVKTWAKPLLKDASDSEIKLAKENLGNLTLQTIPTEFIKVNGKWVSKKICEGNSSFCTEKVIVKAAIIPKNPRTPNQCLVEREKDWKNWCWNAWNGGMQIDCDNAEQNSKKDILDKIAEQPGSSQGKCLRGE